MDKRAGPVVEISLERGEISLTGMEISPYNIMIAGIPHRNKDIECVLLSFLSEKFVSTKWRIYKGILVGPRLMRRGISRGCRDCELFFSTAKFAKIFISRLKMEKK
jgi:hypothetical protein